MNFLERLYKKEPNPLLLLHPDFKLSHGDSWVWNRQFSLREQNVGVKARFIFDDPSLLDGLDILTKIGINNDPNVAGKYVGFSYVDERDIDKLKACIPRFPFAELITNLDTQGVSTDKSERIRVTPEISPDK